MNKEEIFETAKMAGYHWYKTLRVRKRAKTKMVVDLDYIRYA